MTWTNILAPLLGGKPDDTVLEAAAALASPFQATVTAAYASSLPSSLFAWSLDTGVGVTGVAVEELQRVSSAGEVSARALVDALDYPRKAFENVTSEDWRDLRMASRLADVVVWPPSAAQGHGFFAGAFQQILMDERRPVLVAASSVEPGGLVAVAWDGGREASRAARRAIPWLRKAQEVVVLTAPHAMAHPCNAAPLIAYLADHGVSARPMPLHAQGEAGPLILETTTRLGARLLVTGAYGHPRLQRFIFGGTTQVLLGGSSTTALFLSH